MKQKVIPSHLLPPSLPASLACANSLSQDGVRVSSVILGTSAHIQSDGNGSGKNGNGNGSGNGSGSGNAYTYSTEDRFRLPSSSSSTLNNNDSLSGPLSSGDGNGNGNGNSYSSSKNINPKRKGVHENHNENEIDGLCLDQRGFFAHLKPRSLIISTLRISLIQASQIFTTYLTDQLAHESELEEQLVAGDITDLQLDLETALWEDREWDGRWSSLVGRHWYDWENGKIQKALVKYHVLTLVMRSYEAALGWKLSREMMDRLTKDTFSHAKRRAVERNQDASGRQGPSSGRHTNADYTNTNTSTTAISYRMEMFQSCLYANMVSFLSDYTIQQTILCYGYYTFLKNFRRERRLNMLMNMNTNDCDDNNNDDDDDGNLNLKNNDCKQHHGPKLEDDLVNGEDAKYGKGYSKGEDTPADTDAVKWNDDDSDGDSDTTLALSGSTSEGGIVLSFIYKSSKLIVVRAIGLLVAGIGGAIGSTIRPGYGTLLGTQLGDACVGVLLEE